MLLVDGTLQFQACIRFNGHPPLGVNATDIDRTVQAGDTAEFQWAPTLGGECYVVQ